MAILVDGSKTWTQCVKDYGTKLDKLALCILERHRKNHLSCVALSQVDNQMLITTNGFTPEMEILELFPYNFKYLSQSHLSQMHAEMKLLSVLRNDYQYTDDMFKGMTIAVSKPCCILCATVLNYYGVNYSMWHNEQTSWLSPYIASNIGDKVYEQDDKGCYHAWLEYPKDFPYGVDMKKIWKF